MAETATLPAVSRPEDADGPRLDELPRRLQALYGAIDHIHDTCRIAGNIDSQSIESKDDEKHLEYLRYRLARAERHLRNLRRKLTR